MTTKEALEVFRQEDHSIRILRDPETADVFITKPTEFGTVPPTILAWVCGQESNHFISYEGLSAHESYLALNALAETMPKLRGGINND